jgi:hypothetical protein
LSVCEHALLTSLPSAGPTVDFAATSGTAAAADAGGVCHLCRQSIVAGENISCTACAGTLLLEFDLLLLVLQLLLCASCCRALLLAEGSCL